MKTKRPLLLAAALLVAAGCSSVPTPSREWIPKDELPRIFDRFYRGTNARADNAGGSGLGLSIAQWIVREHGGTIEAISGSGFGTRMTIVLPEEAAEQ